MTFRIIAALISTICLIVLVFTDLTFEQRLLLAGVVLFEAADSLSSYLAYRRNSN